MLVKAFDKNNIFAFVTQRPYCPGRPKKLCFTAQSLAVKTVAARLCVVKQSFFGLQGQYGRRVTKAIVRDKNNMSFNLIDAKNETKCQFNQLDSYLCANASISNSNPTRNKITNVHYPACLYLFLSCTLVLL